MMPWRKLTAAQWVILLPLIIRALAWLLLLLGSVMKMLGYPEIATIFYAISSALGLVDAKNELGNLKGGN